MPESYERLALPVDPSFQSRLGDLLVAQLREGGGAANVGAPGPVAPDPDGAPVVVVRPASSAPARRMQRWLAIAAAAAVIAALVIIAVVRRPESGPVTPLPAPTTTTSSSTAPRAALGPERPATGAPVTVAFVADADAGGGTSQIDVAQAVVRYVNEHLGGVAGRPIELVTCTTGDVSSDADARACVNSLLPRQPVALLATGSLQGLAVESIASVAGIPYVAFESFDGAGYGTTSFLLNSFYGPLAAPLTLAASRRVQSGIVVVDDAPGLVDVITALLTPSYRAAGVSVTFLPVAHDGSNAAAVAEQIATAAPDHVQLVAVDPACLSLVDALQRRSYGGIVYANGGCLDSPATQQSSVDRSGVDRISILPLTPAGPEGDLYRAVLASYAPGVDAAGFDPARAYATVVGFARAVSGLSGDVTSASIRTAIETMTPQPLPLYGGQTFTCVKRQPSRNVDAQCSAFVEVSNLGSDGEPTKTEVVDVSDYASGT